MSESTIQKRIRLKLSEIGAKMFRINVGMAWTGDKIVRISKSDIIIRNARPFHSGPPKGYPDLAGWKPTEITPDMVGKKVAVFMGVEVKNKRGRVSKDQQRFLDAIEQDGGIAIVARTEDDVF